MYYLVSQYLLLPQNPGVYLLLNNRGQILYVGKAKNLKNRVSSYFANPSLLLGKTKIMVSQIKKIKVIIVESEVESLLLEANLIKKYAPKYNIRLTDGKAYPHIRITNGSLYPSVLIARKMDDPTSVYFGPFPSSTSVHLVLKLLRRIFPFHSALNHAKRICLYYHLHLCPCVAAHPTKEHIDAYKKTIHHILDFLHGKTKKVLKDLEKERNTATKKENYEQAAILQKQIDAIIYITHPTHQPFEYETNPNLRSDIRQEELLDLQKLLANNGVTIALPERIECYDNSNIQGTNPTSSLVVLTNGEIDKSQYRKFNITTVVGPNDFATMQEVLQRRMKHDEWPLPQLFVVDGGKGQVSAAKEVLEGESVKRKGVRLVLIGLAKREETIITSDLKEIHLPRESKALQLIMRIRDEAHRFAITHHRKLRSQSVFT